MVKLYIYRDNLSENPFELFHILPNIDYFSIIDGKSKLWARDIIREGTYQGLHTKFVTKGLRWVSY